VSDISACYFGWQLLQPFSAPSSRNRKLLQHISNRADKS
jgi:hypothetical protein